MQYLNPLIKTNIYSSKPWKTTDIAKSISERKFI